MNDLKHVLKKNIHLVILVIVIIHALYSYYSLAYKLEKTELERHGKGYVSDEVWYVSSARNILRKVFGINASIPGRYGVSIIYNKTIPYNVLKQIASKHHVELVDTNYYEIKAFYIEANNESSIKEFIRDVKPKIQILDVIPGWRIPDAANINNYLNTEHPPMVKYLIALSIAVLGDRPLYWRIPSIIAGVLLVLLTYILSINLTGNKWISLIVALLVSVDPITRALSSIALLDVFVALFTVSALIPVIKKNYIMGIIIAAIGATFKFSVLFVHIPIIILYIRSKLLRDPRLLILVQGFVEVFVIVILFFALFQILSSIPLIMYLGLTSWLDQSIFGAIAWHTSVKCSGNCPLTSTPLDWFIGVNGFPLYYFSGSNALIALGMWPFWILSLASALLFLPGYLVERRYGYANLFLLGSWSGYVILWFIGGRTQYSFYSIQFVSLVYLLLIVAITYIILEPAKGKKVIYYWYHLIHWLWNTLLFLLKIPKPETRVA